MRLLEAEASSEKNEDIFFLNEFTPAEGENESRGDVRTLFKISSDSPEFKKITFEFFVSDVSPAKKMKAILSALFSMGDLPDTTVELSLENPQHFNFLHSLKFTTVWESTEYTDNNNVDAQWRRWWGTVRMKREVHLAAANPVPIGPVSLFTAVANSTSTFPLSRPRGGSRLRASDGLSLVRPHVSFSYQASSVEHQSKRAATAHPSGGSKLPLEEDNRLTRTMSMLNLSSF